MESQDNTGDGDGDILGEDGGLDHDVPGPRVHQPAQSVAEDEECEAADQAVHRHQLETVATTEGGQDACSLHCSLRCSLPAIQLQHEESTHKLPCPVAPGSQSPGEVEGQQGRRLSHVW